MRRSALSSSGVCRRPGGPAPFFVLDRGISGTAGGTGAPTARGLASCGADVACLEVSVPAVQETVTAIEAAGSWAVAVADDMTVDGQVAYAVGRLGPGAYAVNWAGIHGGAPMELMPAEQ